jgi:BirA family biotin operon repressor/biotin-[acetyl-CoA-carboxylase] ligase
MVNQLSTKARLLIALRTQAGEPLNGNRLAQDLGVSRVAVWKGIQALTAAGYAIETQGAGYALNTAKGNDFLYPWEFGEKEVRFRHFASTGSTMDRAREFALQGLSAGTVITADKQSAGRGRNGNPWSSRQGGLFCTILERPRIALADYCLPSIVIQIAAARALSSLCGKPASLRWPNDIYIDRRKIAGVMTELEGEGDMLNWLAIGIGINANNTAPSGRAVSCAEITGHAVSRSALLLAILDEAERVKKHTQSDTAYSQGNRLLAAEWNSMSDYIGVRAAVVPSAEASASRETGALRKRESRIFARGIFAGIDPAGRCIIKSENGKKALYFNPGQVSLVLWGERN